MTPNILRRISADGTSLCHNSAFNEAGLVFDLSFGNLSGHP
ncbi:hypothetical protein [Colwellia ponticola]|nr:hypothetical protein [Colwellia ponticola]